MRSALWVCKWHMGLCACSVCLSVLDSRHNQSVPSWHHVLCAMHSWKLKNERKENSSWHYSPAGLMTPESWAKDEGRSDICRWLPLPPRLQHKLSKCRLQIAWPSACGTKCAHNSKFITNLRVVRYEREYPKPFRRNASRPERSSHTS